MISTHKTTALIFTALTTCAIYTYFNFSLYKPKAIAQVEDVRSYNTEDFSIIYPEDYKELGINKIMDGKQITLTVNKTPQEIQNFYKNIYTLKGWKVESESQVGDFLVTKYKSNNRTVLISTTKAGNDTIVGIEIKIED